MKDFEEYECTDKIEKFREFAKLKKSKTSREFKKAGKYEIDSIIVVSRFWWLMTLPQKF